MAPDHQPEPSLYRIPKLKYHARSRDFRVALVSLSVPVGGLSETRLDGRRLWPIAEEGLDGIRAQYIETIESLTDDIDLVVFGEMTYPAGRDGAPAEFSQRLQQLAQDKNLYIVAGSTHQVDAPRGERYNASRIFYPQDGRIVEQLKFTTAANDGEDCDVPNLRVTHVHEAIFASFAVSICIDVDDLRIWAKIAKRTRAEKMRGIDILVIPAFDNSQSISGTAKHWGRHYQVPFVYVNACERHGETEEPLAQNAAGKQLEPSVDGKVYVFHFQEADFTAPLERTEGFI